MNNDLDYLKKITTDLGLWTDSSYVNADEITSKIHKNIYDIVNFNNNLAMGCMMDDFKKVINSEIYFNHRPKIKKFFELTTERACII